MIRFDTMQNTDTRISIDGKCLQRQELMAIAHICLVLDVPAGMLKAVASTDRKSQSCQSGSLISLALVGCASSVVQHGFKSIKGTVGPGLAGMTGVAFE